MKIIDLFNMVVRGDKLPERIKVDGIEFRLWNPELPLDYITVKPWKNGKNLFLCQYAQPFFRLTTEVEVEETVKVEFKNDNRV